MGDCLYYYDKNYEDPTSNPQNKGVCQQKIFRNLNNPSFRHSDFINFINKHYDSFGNNIENPFKFARGYINMTSNSLCKRREIGLNPQQKFAGQLVNPNTNVANMLIYHGLGSGKTCTGLVIGQSFANKRYKNIFIVVPAALERQYYDEIVGTIRDDELWSCTSQCIMTDTDGNLNRRFYSNVKEQNAINSLKDNIKNLERDLGLTPNTDIEKISRITNQIKNDKMLMKQKQEKVINSVSKVFTITTHDKFINSLLTIENNKIKSINRGLENGSALYKDDTILIIDEIQNLVSESGVKYKILYLTMRYFANLNLRKVFLTATPIYDNPYEYALTINLMNPRVPFPATRKLFNNMFIGKIIEENGEIKCVQRGQDEKIDYVNSCLINKDLFKYMSSGYVSYFKGGNPNAYPYKRTLELFHYITLDNKNSYIQALKTDLMNEVKRVATRLKKRMKSGGKADEKIEGLLFDIYNQNSASGILPLTRQAVNVSLTKDAMAQSSLKEPDEDEETTIDLEPLSTKAKVQRDVQEGMIDAPGRAEPVATVNTGDIKSSIQRNIHGLSRVDTLNAIYSMSPKMKKIIEISESEERSVFVYSNWVGAGVEAFATFLDTLGYVKFPAKGLKRYFVWSPSIESDQTIINNARIAFNGGNNKDGSVIKFMIGTSSIKEGVSFRNVGQVHIIDPWWNNSRIEQITARAIRLCSHTSLPTEKQFVDVYKHYSIFNSYFNGTADPDAENALDTLGIDMNMDQITEMALGIVKKTYSWVKYLTIDQKILEIANRKDTLNNKFLGAIKSASVDCFMLKEGNIIRLEENIRQIASEEDDKFQVFYKNPSTLDIFIRDAYPDILGWDDIRARRYSYPNSIDFTRKFIEAEYSDQDGKLIKLQDSDTIVVEPANKYLNMPEKIDCWNNKQKLSELTIVGDAKYILNKADMQTLMPDIRKYFLLEERDAENEGITFSPDDRMKKERIVACLSAILKDKNVPREIKSRLNKIFNKIEIQKEPLEKIKMIVEYLGEPESKITEYLEIYQHDPRMIEEIFNQIV